jgi:predicted nucleic acid-binding protein
VKRFVLDASIALAWFLDRPTPQYANRVRLLLLHGHRAVVPSLWQLEMANGFVVAERRGMFSSVETSEALQQLDVVIAHSVDASLESVSMRSALQSARQFRLTAYGAVYLETALRENLPIATLDKQLHSAASKAGIEVIS